ncbi:eCIS core domain-containing protein [Tenacibaculum sp. ZS6-P6]|uniref:eCIS core domain-containing protein n=1 Tax=Tenacibaculum sp. ZS6-P6 TaxID=3447503 RepID=UPI003F97CC37
MKKQAQIQRKETKISVSQHIGQRKENGSNGCSLIDNRSSSVVQKKENNTGLSDNLKAGIENLSGYAMDDVKVHYNSDKPAQLNAHAYAQGTDIHVASGQEKHVPHEAWHVVQQKQGRVQPTTAVNGAQVNDNVGLETEADVMGAKALNTEISNSVQLAKKETTSGTPVQMFNKGVAAFGGLAGFVLAGANPLLGLGMALLGGGIGGLYGDNLFRDEEEPGLGGNLNLPIVDELDQRNQVLPQENPLQIINALQGDPQQRRDNLGTLINTPTGRFVEDLVENQDNYPVLPMNPQHLAIGTDSDRYPNMNMLRPVLEQEHNEGQGELPTFLTGHLYNQAEEFNEERNRQFIQGFINGIPQEGEERANYRVTLNHNMVNAWTRQRQEGESFNDFVQRRYPPRDDREYDGTRQEISDLINAGFTPINTNGSRMTLGLN